jgi:ferric-dicitrate binding protein FerR (iron transport regulator)
VIVRTPFAEATAQGSRFRVDRWNDELSVRSRAGPVHFAAAGATVVIASGQESSARAGKRPWEPRVPGEKSHRR